MRRPPLPGRARRRLSWRPPAPRSPRRALPAGGGAAAWGVACVGDPVRPPPGAPACSGPSALRCLQGNGGHVRGTCGGSAWGSSQAGPWASGRALTRELARCLLASVGGCVKAEAMGGGFLLPERPRQRVSHVPLSFQSWGESGVWSAGRSLCCPRQPLALCFLLGCPPDRGPGCGVGDTGRAFVRVLAQPGCGPGGAGSRHRPRLLRCV